MTARWRYLLQTVSGRLVVLGLLLLATLAVAMLAVEFDRSAAALRAREAQQLAQLEILAAPALAAPLAAGDVQAAEILLADLQRAGGFRYLVLLDREQRQLAAAGRERGRALPPAVPAEQALRTSGPVDTYLTLRQQGRVIGILQLQLPHGEQAELRMAVLRDSLVAGISVIATGVTLMALFGLSLRRHLRRVRDGLSALGEGKLPAKLPVRGPSEVRELTRSLNLAGQQLEHRIEALREGEARFHAIADYTYGAEAWFNTRGRLIWVNRSIERVTGFTPLECVLAGNLIELLVYPKDRKFAVEAGLAALKGGSGNQLELRLQKKDGQVVWVTVNWQPIYSDKGRNLGLRVSLDEIQARKEAELRLLETVAELRRAQGLKDFYLQRSNEERLRLEALLDVMKIGVLFIDRDRRVRYCNRALFRIWGFDEGDSLSGVRDRVLLEHIEPQVAEPQAFRLHVEDVLARRETSVPFDTVLGDGRIINDVSAPVLGAAPGQLLGRVWIYEDVTEARRWTRRLTELAERDALTNLYNRRRFGEEIERLMADAERRQGQLGLLMIDLDGFKPINDQCGHQAGDEVLVRIAREVGETVRRNELFFRMGGDEFAVLAPDVDEREMIGLARRVANTIGGLVFEFGGREHQVTASIGVALYPRDADSPDVLLSCADFAMYQAKASGKNRWEIYAGPAAAAGGGL